MSAGLYADVGVQLGSLHLEARLRVPPSETVAVLGPNGAGKTTLVRALAGLLALDRGSVVLDGSVLDDATTGAFVAPERRPIGVVVQEHLLFPHLSVVENVAFGLRSRGTRRREARRLARDWLEQLGLSGLARARPAQLSGGESQQVALARALVTAPRMLLLDEPFSALDASTRPAIRRHLRRHLDGYEGVRIVVTHDPLEAAALADRLIVLERGRVVQEGPPAEIRRQPRSRYVADLVGVNLFTGRADGRHVALDGGASLTTADTAEGSVLAVVHPRAVVLHRHQPEGTARNMWEGTVGSLDREGERVRVCVGGRLPIVAEVTPGAVDDLSLGEGAPVWVSVKATEISVFPA